MILIIRFIIRLASSRTYSINHLVWLSLMNGGTSFNANLIVASAFMMLVALIIIETVIEYLCRGCSTNSASNTYCTSVSTYHDCSA